VNAVIDIRLLGPFHIEGLSPDVNLSRHAIGLVALVAANQGVPIARPHAADLLWNKTPVSKALHSLSQLVYSLKTVLPHGCLHVTGRTIALDPISATVDLTRFKQAVAVEDHAKAIEVYVGHFLDGAAYLTDEFDDWRIRVAASLEGHANGAFAALVSQALEEDDHARAAALAKRALIINPENEHLARVRIESLAGSGDVAKALRELELLRKQFLVGTGRIPPGLSEVFAKQLAALPLLPDGRFQPGVQMRMVGRAEQIKLLRAHWSATRGGCRVALLHGEAGIGKTRLLQHIARRTVLEGARTFMYSCAEAEARLAYSAVAGMIRDGFRSDDTRLLEPEWQAALASFVPELFRGREIASIAHERILWEAVAQYFEATTQSQPVTLALDDYQWADESSRELLIYITRRLANRPLFVLYAGRSQARIAASEDERTIARVIQVPQLTQSDVEDLIADFERDHDIAVTDSFREMVINRIGGRPFFLLEAFRQFKASGGAAPAESVGALLSHADLGKYIIARLSSASAEARSLAAAAATLNREGPLQLLARVTELSPIAAAGAAAELVELGILAESGSIRFAHDLMREAVFLGILPAERSFWHARIADTLATTSEVPPAGEVAFHYEHAGEQLIAYRFARCAAEDALRLHAYSDAEDHHARMLRCASEHNIDEVYAHLVRYVAKSARYQQLIPLLSEVETSARRRNDLEGLLVCEIAHLNVEEQGGYQDRDRLAARAKHIVHMAEQQSPATITTVMWQVAEHIKRSGETGLLERFARILAARGRDASGDTAADLLSVAALLGASSIGYRFGTPLAEESVTIAQNSGDSVVFARALFARGTLRLWSGHLAGASQDFEKALAAVDRFAPDGLIHSIQANYAVVLMEQSLLDEAEHQAKAALSESRSTKRAYSYGNLALVSLRRSDQAGARQYIDCLMNIFSVTPETWMPVHAEAILGLLDLERGDTQSALNRAAAIESMLNAAVEASDSSHIHLLCARVSDLKCDASSAIQRLESAAAKVALTDYVGWARLQLEAASLRISSGASPSDAANLVAIRDHCRAHGANALLARAEQLLSHYN
jgi:DNA-binding SARP family transcriptional activator